MKSAMEVRLGLLPAWAREVNSLKIEGPLSLSQLLNHSPAATVTL